MEINADISDEQLTALIERHDRVVMLGHGTPEGMLGHGRYVIDHSHANLLREKDLVMIWCNADKFVEQHNLHGLYTGMMISDGDEARLMYVAATDSDILFSNELFSTSMREAIGYPQPDAVAKTMYHVPSNMIVEYNRTRIYYSRKGDNN